MVVSKCEQRPGGFGVTLVLQGVSSVFLADSVALPRTPCKVLPGSER
jgi:hypothetical protein